MALMQELRSALGFRQQVNLKTPVQDAELWSLRQTNRSIPQPTLVTENDADWLGKGIWTTAVYPTNWDVNFPWEARLTSENFTQCAAFALGRATESGTAPALTYTIVPIGIDPADCLHDMPTTTFLALLRNCNEDVVNTALLGVACEEFTVSLNSGPGLDNATITSTWVGTGQFQSPSTLALPPFATEHSLRAGGATVTFLGIPYVSNRRFVSCNFGYKNNIKLEQGFFPGSGSQNNASIRGRMRRGVPTVTLNFVAEYEHDSTELDLFLAQTQGSVTIGVQGETNHGFTIVAPRVLFSAAVLGENDNTLTVSVDCQVLQNPGTGEVVTITAKTSQAGILAPSAATPLAMTEGEEVPKAA